MNITRPIGAQAAAKSGVLSGITVVDLTHIYNGPYATFLMAMAGANVIKVEPPKGEHLRHRAELGGAGVPFAMLNSNKQAVTLDLKTEPGKELLLQLVERADVFVENFAPGAMDRLGLGAEVLRSRNPHLVYASSTGFGHSGPYRDFPAMDLTIQAFCGAMATTGFPDSPPLKAGPAIGDFFGGVHLFGAIVSALLHRERTGKVVDVEISMLEATYASLSSSIGMYFDSGLKTVKRTGNRHSGLAEAPYNVYPTKDGFVAIIGNNDRHFQSILRLIGRHDLFEDPRFIGIKNRAANIDAIDELVGAWTSGFTKQEVADMLISARVPCAPVREVEEIINDRHMHERGTLKWVDHPQFGRIVVQRSPLRFGGIEAEELRLSQSLGESNEAVFKDWLGLTQEEFDAAKNDRII